eukprot:8496459-Karenia_brevis.AAC.1
MECRGRAKRLTWSASTGPSQAARATGNGRVELTHDLLIDTGVVASAYEMGGQWQFVVALLVDDGLS